MRKEASDKYKDVNRRKLRDESSVDAECKNRREGKKTRERSGGGGGVRGVGGTKGREHKAGRGVCCNTRVTCQYIIISRCNFNAAVIF